MSRNNIASFWQSGLWADILSSTGQAEVISYVLGDTSLLIERRKIWKSFSGLFILGVDTVKIHTDILEDIQKHIAHPSDLFLQIEPLSDFVENTREKIREKEKREFIKNQKAPFRRFLEPTTAIIPLSGMTEDVLIQRFHEKGRYNIRVAERRGLIAHWVQSKSISPYTLPGGKGGEQTHMELFFSLLKETTERDNFAHNSLSYYQEFVATLEKNNAGGLLFATKDNTLHAAGIFVYTDNMGIYYYGASPSNAEIRRDHGTYLLQWEAMCESLRRGCDEYDFLGISSREGDKLAGVTAFKMRFNPEKVTLPSEKIIILRPIPLFLLQCMSKVRRFFK